MRARAAVVLTCLALTACGGAPHPGLAAVTKDPLATRQFPGASPIRTDLSDGSAGLLGKPSPVRAQYAFRIEPGNAPGKVLADAVRLARADGWTVPDEQNFPDAFAGTKNGARMHLSTTVIDGHDELVLILHPAG